MSDENLDTGDTDTDTTVQPGDDTNSDVADPSATDDTGTQPEGGDADGDGSGQDTDSSSQTSPDAYADFDLPEEVALDEALLAEASPLFKELGLTQEQAQKLVDFQAKQVQAGSQSQVDAFNQLMDDWQDQSRNDKEFGGDKFDENVAVARNAIAKFGTPELKQLLEEHGVGNHPEVIRFMVKVGKLTAEDVPGGTTTPQSKAQDRVSILYPTENDNA